MKILFCLLLWGTISSGVYAQRVLPAKSKEQKRTEKQIEKKVQQEARESAEKLMREQINGYSSVSIKNADFRALKEKWSYTLLPVWTITYKAKNGKIYYFSMNGQTGKVYGELPIDYKKISLVSGIVSLVTLVILLLGGLA